MPKVIDETRVMRAALNLVVLHGYEGATTQRIAAMAEVNEATLFRRYGSKLGLIERAIEHQLSTAPLSQVTYTGDLRADLHGILDAYVATNETYGDILPILFLEIPRNPELRSVLQTPLANIQGLVDIIARYQNDGLLKDEPPLMTVSVLLAPILMNHMLRQANTDMPAPALDLSDYVEAFLNGREPP